MRQIVLQADVSEGPAILDVAERPDRVWLWNTAVRPPDVARPRHLVNARLEDETHDWRWRDGRLRYMGVGHGTDTVWLVLQYDESSTDCAACGTELPDGARFCMHCGAPTD